MSSPVGHLPDEDMTIIPFPLGMTGAKITPIFDCHHDGQVGKNDRPKSPQKVFWNKMSSGSQSKISTTPLSRLSLRNDITPPMAMRTEVQSFGTPRENDIYPVQSKKATIPVNTQFVTQVCLFFLLLLYLLFNTNTCTI